MMAKLVFDYLEPYLPYHLISAISMAVFLVEKFLVPKVYEIYSHASLDPKTLLPFVFSAIALYLSVVSIYHAFKAAFRMTWFMIKWSLVIAFVWFILGFLNEMGANSGAVKSGKNVFQSYRNSASTWWKPSTWGTTDFNQQNLFEPMQLIFGQGLLSFLDPSTIFEPMLSHFRSRHGQDSFRQQNNQYSSSSHSSSEYRNQNQNNHWKNPRSPKSEGQDEKLYVLEAFRQFWVQRVQNPLQSVLQEAQRRHEMAKASSESSARSNNRWRMFSSFEKRVISYGRITQVWVSYYIGFDFGITLGRLWLISFRDRYIEYLQVNLITALDSSNHCGFGHVCHV